MKAYAIVKKKKPKVSTLDIYNARQIKLIKLAKDEKIIPIYIYTTKKN